MAMAAAGAHDTGMGHDHDAAPANVDRAVLDIGGTVGALILITGRERLGDEIEVSPLEAPDRRVHTAIHERRIGDRVIFAGLYPALEAGTYRIWVDDPALVDTVTIVGGEVAEVDWTASTAPATPARDDRDGPDGAETAGGD
jgi:hypothetical protein